MPLIALMTSWAVLMIAPPAFVARRTVIAFSSDRDRDRRAGRAGIDELRRDAVAALVAPRLRAQQDRARRVGAGERRGAAGRRLVGLAGRRVGGGVERHVGGVLVADHRRRLVHVAPGLLGRLDRLGDGRELGGQGLDALVALLRHVVARVEVREEGGGQPGRRRVGPGLGLQRVDVAVRGRDLDRGRHGESVALGADPVAGDVVLVVVRVDVGVEERVQVAAAELVAGGVIPGGHELRAGVGAAGARGRVGARDLRVGRVRLDRDVAARGVLVVVGALCPHGAGRRARARLAGLVDAQRELGRALVGDRLLALGADAVDVELVVDDADVLEAVGAHPGQLVVGHPRLHDHATVGELLVPRRPCRGRAPRSRRTGRRSAR